MGKEAKAKAEARKAWIASLTPDENKGRNAAEQLLENFILPARTTGMCYRMTFFLHLYLSELGIDTQPVVGWVTDGRDDLAISHAWLEQDGKKIDLTLVNVDRNMSSIPGKAIILDKASGMGADYSYFRAKEDRHLQADEGAAEFPEIRQIMSRKQAEHEQMTALATDAAEMRRFLDAAPDGWTFERLKERVFAA